MNVQPGNIVQFILGTKSCGSERICEGQVYKIIQNMVSVKLTKEDLHARGDDEKIGTRRMIHKSKILKIVSNKISNGGGECQNKQEPKGNQQPLF